MFRYPDDIDRYPDDMDRYPLETRADVDYLDDRIRPLPAGAARTRRLPSLPTALGVAFVVTTLALGATISADPTSSPAGAGERPVAAAGSAGSPGNLGYGSPAETKDADRPGGGGEPGEEQVKPSGEPTDDPQPTEKSRPTDEPKSTAEPKPADGEPDPTKAPAPAVAKLALGLQRDGGSVVVDWTRCEVDGFYAYKVVRSPDAKIGWPLADGDKLVAVVDAAATTAVVDATVTVGRAYYYKVIGFAERDGGGYTACASPTKGIELEAPRPDPTKAPAPGLELAVAIKEGVVLLDWSTCAADGFDAYKIVRSKDSTVAFPAGDADTLIAAVGPDGKTALWDKEAPAGKTVWYRVFCVDKGDGTYRVVAASPARSVTVPAAAPKPTPEIEKMGLEVEQTADGVALLWQASGSDAFAFYKVVRSRSDNPSYLPGTAGSEVIGVIDSAATTTFVDGGADGGTWFYRVQAIGHVDGQKVLVGQTPVRSITVE